MFIFNIFRTIFQIIGLNHYANTELNFNGIYELQYEDVTQNKQPHYKHLSAGSTKTIQREEIIATDGTTSLGYRWHLEGENEMTKRKFSDQFK